MKTAFKLQTEWLRRFHLESPFYAAALLLGIYACNKALSESNPNDYLVNIDRNGVIIDGYDPVAFFTENKPVKGNPQINTKYNHATYYFSTDENRRTFEQHPSKYEPQFGGFCAYAVSLGRTAPIDVHTFSIVEGRLVIQHNEKAVKGWEQDPVGNLHKADKYWPRVVANNGKQIKTDEDAD